MDRKLHLLETFSAMDDQGVAHKVCGYEHVVQLALLPGAIDQWEPTGIFEYRLEGGERLETFSDGSFRVAATGTRLTRR